MATKTTTICLSDAARQTVESIPKFLRSRYIDEAIQQRVAKEGPPKYSDEDVKRQTGAMAAQRAVSALRNLDEAALAAAGFVRATPAAPTRVAPAPAPGKGPATRKA